MSNSKPLSNFSFAWQYLKTEQNAFVLALVFILLNAGLQTLTPIAIEFLINNAIKIVNYTLLWQVTAIMCMLYLLEAFIFQTQVKTVGYASQRIMVKIRTNLFKHIQNLKSDFFGQNQSGDLISRINSDTTLLDNFLGQYIFAFTSSFFVFIAFGIYLAILNWQLAILAYLGVVLTVVISYLINPIVKQTNKTGLESNGKLKGYLADNLNNYQVIQAYNIHSKLSSEFNDYNLENQRTNQLSRTFTNVFAPIYNFAGNFALLLILAVVFYYKFGSTSLEIAALIAFVFATIKFFSPLRELGSVFGSFAEAVAALARIREILNEPVNNIFQKESTAISEKVDIDKLPLAKGFAAQADWGYTNETAKINDAVGAFTDTAIRFINVGFTYPKTEQKILDDISFTVPTNSKFAIIGPTGEGKSTIAKLMSGLLSQDTGTIKVFDKELKDWNQDEFYNTIGFILQDPFLFSGTVASNIVYGNPRYSEFNKAIIEEKNVAIKETNKAVVSNSPREGWQAKPDGVFLSDATKPGDKNLKTDHTNTVVAVTNTQNLIQALTKDIKEHELDSIIHNLQEFLATEVNNNSQNISQGQKQIVNFIRVLLREPKILILDEATANLDTITEQFLQKALDKLANKVTQIVIAHRQNTIQDADYVMLVGGGKVSVEEKIN
jgi:ATP-binding cassette, subfamily B, bacterial